MAHGSAQFQHDGLQPEGSLRRSADVASRVPGRRRRTRPRITLCLPDRLDDDRESERQREAERLASARPERKEKKKRRPPTRSNFCQDCDAAAAPTSPSSSSRSNSRGNSSSTTTITSRGAGRRKSKSAAPAPAPPSNSSTASRAEAGRSWSTEGTCSANIPFALQFRWRLRWLLFFWLPNPAA